MGKARGWLARFPEVMKFGAYDYELEPLDRVDAGVQRIYGDTDHEKQLIRIDLSIGYRLAGATLDHEQSHPVLHQTRAARQLIDAVRAGDEHVAAGRISVEQFEHSIEELVIALARESMHPVYRDNPEATRWWVEGIIRDG